MNSWLILLLLLSCNRNGRGYSRDYDCGCDQGDFRRFPGGRDWERDSNNDCERDSGRGRNRDNDGDCDCDDDRDSRGFNNNESRFEPRFDGRPFNNSECGCNNQ